MLQAKYLESMNKCVPNKEQFDMFGVRFDKEPMAKIPNQVRVTGQGVCFNFKVRGAQLEVN